MRYNLAILVVMLLVAFPTSVFAHIGMMAEADHSNSEDSEIAGDAMVTTEEFSQIEDTMIKMMNDENLSDDEIVEMYEFMHEHNAREYMMPMHGSGGTYRMPMADWGGGAHMFGQWGTGGGFPYWFSVVNQFVWLFAGVLLVAFLIKKLKNA